MAGRDALVAGLLLLGAADLAALDLVAAPAWLGSAAPMPAERPAARVANTTTRAPASRSSLSFSPPSTPPTASVASVAASSPPTAEPPTAESSAAVEATPPPAALAAAPKLPRLVFQRGSSVLTPASVDTLMKASRFLKSVPEASLAIHAHGWQEGDGGTEQAISEKRAAITADFLVAVGLDRSRLRTIAHGSADPADRSDTPDATARNRRVELAFETRGSTR